MIKTIFVLVLMNTQGGINADLHFPTLQQCEQVKTTLSAVHPNKGNIAFIAGECVEQKITPKRLKCSIENKTDYKNPRNFAGSVNMDAYSYPVGFTCIEE